MDRAAQCVAIPGCAHAGPRRSAPDSLSRRGAPCTRLVQRRERTRNGMIRTMTFALAAASLLCLSSRTLLSQAAAQEPQTIRVGWTIPAEESKYWMMRRPDQFSALGKAYKVEWVQFQCTAPMVQAMAAGALDCSTQGVLSMAQGAI